MYSSGFFFLGLWVLVLLGTLYWLHRKLVVLQNQADQQRDKIVESDKEKAQLRYALESYMTEAQELSRQRLQLRWELHDAHQNLEMVLASTPNWFDDIEAEIGINGVVYQFRKNQQNEPVMVHLDVDTTEFVGGIQQALEAVEAIQIYEALDGASAFEKKE